MPIPKMPYKPAECMSKADVLATLNGLDVLLSHLPTALPIKKPQESKFGCFMADSFTVDPENSDEPLVTETHIEPVKNDRQVATEEKKSMNWD